MKTSYFERNPWRELPDGRIVKVFPFHISLEGNEIKVLCRDDDDYDTFVKIMAVCAKRKCTILIAFGIVSNHGHSVILAENKDTADRFGQEVKKMFSMYFQKKYGDSKIMKGIGVNAQWLDSLWYLRNAIAYDILNALDNFGYSIEEYPWSSYKAYFRKDAQNGKKVSELGKADKRRIMHTDDDLSGVDWTLDSSNRLIPSSICDSKYVEAAFENDSSIFVQKIGNTNVAEMHRRLEDNPKVFRKDEEVLRSVRDLSLKWFSSEIHDLPYEKKIRLLTYYFRSNRTSTSQMARIFEMPRGEVSLILKKNGFRAD